MRWIWIDRIMTLEPGRRCVSVKNVTASEDVLHDHFPASEGRPARPVMPNPLIIEGMAQTAGILVGHARAFQERVILAKISKARFQAAAVPGTTIRHTACLEHIDTNGASTSGVCELIDSNTGHARPLGEVELMFSHVDPQRAGLELPEHNFVFTPQFIALLREVDPEAALSVEKSA